MKAFLVIFGLLALDILLLAKIPSLLLAVVLGIVSVIITMRIIKHNLLKELAISGSFLSFIAAYHFYFQPVFNETLPSFSDAIMIFFGSYIAFRGLISLGKLIPIPFITPISIMVVGE